MATTKESIPTSPTRSDKSSESEGKPVREKLQETRLDAQSSSDPTNGDQITNGITGAATALRDPSVSGSDSDRGRLRRKRSRENFEEPEDGASRDEQSGRHVRKKSSFSKAVADDGDHAMVSVEESSGDHDEASKGPSTPENGVPEDGAMAVTSPTNKRSRDQVDIGEVVALENSSTPAVEGEPTAKVGEEPHAKRQRDKNIGEQATDTSVDSKKSSGFANTSAASPFTTLSGTESSTPDPVPQTSAENFKASGFSSFAQASSSPFGGLGSKNTSSPFASTAGSKLASFASPATTSATTSSGFGSLGSTSKPSAFGGSSLAPPGGKSLFGGSLASGFGSLGPTKTGLSTFASSSSKSITGLSEKPAKPFGAPEEAGSDEDDGSDSDDSADDEQKDRRVSEPERRFQVQERETGEEGEDTRWSGRAKLYTLDKDKKQWKEAGVGPFKLNVTKDSPMKARFLLRADGTQRLVLNAPVTKTLRFGDEKGARPSGGQIRFNSPAANPTEEHKLDLHTLKMKTEKAQELYDLIIELQASSL
ncbi:hypothetical protein EJ04DRAFT_566684 [Polyplosphaeria fusca]|uniref:RanBD1 domain-containing protein n=1 Tax=Polyplosphaeria fusca TaxID=682080 RepID=A0A9P4QV78_9PLEO|nr:hypothetical protein EJ04DRAFT_566684 [Polyplosphaeria fusca]